MSQDDKPNQQPVNIPQPEPQIEKNGFTLDNIQLPEENQTQEDSNEQ